MPGEFSGATGPTGPSSALGITRTLAWNLTWESAAGAKRSDTEVMVAACEE